MFDRVYMYTESKTLQAQLVCRQLSHHAIGAYIFKCIQKCLNHYNVSKILLSSLSGLRVPKHVSFLLFVFVLI